MQRADAARSRILAKLSYARVHLDELDRHPGNGDLFDRAHEESFLFHLDGCVDALLQEINLIFDLGLPQRHVDLVRVKKALGATASAAFTALRRDLVDRSSWIYTMREFRNHATHRAALSRSFYVGGEKHGQVELRHPETDELIEVDRRRLFRRWLDKADTYFVELGNSARAEGGVPSPEIAPAPEDRSGRVDASVTVADTLRPQLSFSASVDKRDG